MKIKYNQEPSGTLLKELRPGAVFRKPQESGCKTLWIKGSAASDQLDNYLDQGVPCTSLLNGSFTLKDPDLVAVPVGGTLVVSDWGTG